MASSVASSASARSPTHSSSTTSSAQRIRARTGSASRLSSPASLAASSLSISRARAAATRSASTGWSWSVILPSLNMSSAPSRSWHKVPIRECLAATGQENRGGVRDARAKCRTPRPDWGNFSRAIAGVGRPRDGPGRKAQTAPLPERAHHRGCPGDREVSGPLSGAERDPPHVPLNQPERVRGHDEVLGVSRRFDAHLGALTGEHEPLAVV